MFPVTVGNLIENYITGNYTDNQSHETFEELKQAIQSNAFDENGKSYKETYLDAANVAENNGNWNNVKILRQGKEKRAEQVINFIKDFYANNPSATALAKTGALKTVALVVSSLTALGIFAGSYINKFNQPKS